MSKEIVTLCENEFVSLYKLIDVENNVNGYVYSHETRCNGNIVAILPFKIFKDSGGKPQDNNLAVRFLVRNEVTPCWGMKKVVSSITGGVEEGMTPNEVAKMELEEEAGYIVDASKFIKLGTCYGTKSCDTIYHLFAVDLTNVSKTGKASGDGSKLEKLAHCSWEDGLEMAKDPIIFALFYKLESWLMLRYGTNLGVI